MKPLNYDEFAAACISELNPLQQNFLDNYDINGFDNWHYDQVSGLFTFSTGEKKLFFRYFDVGSYSTVSNTWMWSWRNGSVHENAKVFSLKVHEFGIQNSLDKLTAGTFECDEITAWELAAVALNINGGIGVYRPEKDGLQMFMVMLEVISEEEAYILINNHVECLQHGLQRNAFVCNHIISGEKVGFEEAFETWENMGLDDDDDLQAWCNACEEVRIEHDGWNDESMKFADIKLVCEKCYFKFKAINS